MEGVNADCAGEFRQPGRLAEPRVQNLLGLAEPPGVSALRAGTCPTGFTENFQHQTFEHQPGRFIVRVKLAMKPATQSGANAVNRRGISR
jgi:hypothetical protein